MTQGYERSMLLSICLYMACRESKLPYFLIDFSAFLKMNVKKLAKVFSRICVQLPYHLSVMDDLSIFIDRYARKLQFGNKLDVVSQTTAHLVKQMKKDWISTGRMPAGIIGACLLISARIHGFRRSLKEVSAIVSLSENTIRKRLKEFTKTKTAKLTVHQFQDQNVENENIFKANKDEYFHPANKYYFNGEKMQKMERKVIRSSYEMPPSLINNQIKEEKKRRELSTKANVARAKKKIIKRKYLENKMNEENDNSSDSTSNEMIDFFNDIFDSDNDKNEENIQINDISTNSTNISINNENQVILPPIVSNVELYFFFSVI